MTKTAIVLRRIIKSIGISKASNSPRQGLHSARTLTHPQVQPHSLEPYDTTPLPAIKPKGKAYDTPTGASGSVRPDNTVFDLLDSIRVHLQAERDGDHKEDAAAAQEKSIEPDRQSSESLQEREEPSNTRTHRYDPSSLDVGLHRFEISSESWGDAVGYPGLRSQLLDTEPSPQVHGRDLEKDSHIPADSQLDDTLPIPQHEIAPIPPQPEQPAVPTEPLTVPKSSTSHDVLQELSRRIETPAQLKEVEVTGFAALTSEEIDERAKWRVLHSESRAANVSKFRDTVEHPVEAEWVQVLRMLESITSLDRDSQQRISQVTSFPENVSVRWLSNAGEATREIWLNTGSHLQMHYSSNHTADGKDDYRSFTLTGTATQNDLARKLMADREDFEIVQKGCGEHSSFGEVLDRSSTVKATTTVQSHPSRPQIRITWSMSSTRAIDIVPLITASLKNITLPTLQLYAAVDVLTELQPKASMKLLRDRFGVPDPCAEALSKLLTNPENVANSTPHIMSIAWRYLAKHGRYDIVRKLQQAQDDHAAKDPFRLAKTMGTEAVNMLLHGCAKSADIHAFRQVLQSMVKEQLSADADTWLNFLRITQALFPKRASETLAKMRELGMLKNEHVRRSTLTYQAVAALESKLAMYDSAAPLPRGFVDEFVASASIDFKTPRWMTSRCARLLVGVLLDRGRWQEALRICEILLQSRKLISRDMLHILLTFAGRASQENASLAVEILRLFAPVIQAGPLPHTRAIESTSTAVFHELQRLRRTAVERSPYRSPRVRLELTASIYDMLFSIAIKTFSWNLTRVIWQHACCAGQVSLRMRQQVYTSLMYRSKLSTGELSKMEALNFWRKSFALFALGIGQALEAGPIQPLVQVRKAMPLYKQDLRAYGHVAPLYSLAEDALAAYRLDEQWKQRAAERKGSTSSRPFDAVWPSDNWANPSAEAMVIPVGIATLRQRRLKVD